MLFFYFLILGCGVLLIIYLLLKEKGIKLGDILRFTNFETTFARTDQEKILLQNSQSNPTIQTPDENLNVFLDFETQEKNKSAAALLHAQTQMDELREKYKKLEALFQEKTETAMTLQRTLENEIRHRHEFSKVKGLLDSQIIRLKEKIQELELALNRYEREEETSFSAAIPSENSNPSTRNSFRSIDIRI